MRKFISLIVRSPAICGVGLTVAVGQAPAMDLITSQEAALPTAIDANLELGVRGVTRGPKVLVVSPALGAGTVRSPLNFLLKFESYGGAAVDANSVRVIYLKRPAINLTQRITDLVKASGIEVHAAEAPPGMHYIRVEVRDDAGRVGSTTFSFTVAD